MITGYKVERCPFCKATQAYLHLRRNPWQVRCGRCGSEGPEARSETEAVERWNKSDGRKRKMAIGNEMTMECEKLVEEIIGELRSFDETPPPKKVWLDIANRLEKAFGQYRGHTMSFMNYIKAKPEDMDSPLDHQAAFKMLGTMEWKETMFLDLQTHDFGGGIFMLRCKHGEPNEHYCIIKALNEGDAIRRAVFDLRKPSEHVGNVGNLRNILWRVHDWLGVLIRDGRPDDRCSQCIGASDLSDDVYDALHSKVRNCDRFNDALDAQLEFLNEVWLISADRESMLERDKFENWTPEMKARYAEWLMELKDAKEGGDKCEPTEQKEQKA